MEELTIRFYNLIKNQIKGFFSHYFPQYSMEISSRMLQLIKCVRQKYGNTLTGPKRSDTTK